MIKKKRSSHKKYNINFAIAVAFVLVCIAFYFFYKTEYPSSKPERVYTNETVTESAAQLVDGFPDIPVYPGLKLDKSYKREQNGKTDYNAFWYHEVPEEEITVLFKWYIDELKARGWEVSGPFADESEDELNLKGENTKYKLTIYNSERDEGDSGGPAGELIGVEIIEK